ncbi:sugar ABC transporter substrate-binding protein [Paenibacillus sp. sptzw28]|uniref:ABC transporter substrate-binding protein n=1 Tax=Paenibacillus sp. sptzw28 TaxID=715179 RepID=UPI001C6EFE02|nr:sugar ABC transporter substrate-binding protein [Paenibacillus sp. sptzw28]QYR21462.1 sugar ABC transporter substrate-binding protein [Paenibacillus sp. sptzw28]
MFKVSKLLVLLLGITIAISACGQANEKKGEAGADQKVQLTAWAWNVNVGALNSALELYKKDHPNVDLKVEDIGRLDVYDKLSTGLAAGGAGLPDIVLVEDDRIQGYLDAFPKGFLNLSDKGFDSKADQFPAFKKELASKDGKFYAFPFDAGPTGMFYRRDIFEKAGVNPDTIETWDQFIEAGKTIKQKTGSFALPADKFKDDALFRMMMNEQGVFYFDKDGNIDFNNPKVVKALETIKAMGDAGLVKDVNGWDGTVSATVDGSVATIPFGAWYYGTITDQAKDTSGKWGVFQLPAFEAGGNRAANLGGSSWMIPSSSKNADAAYAFAEYFATTDAVQEIAMDKHGLFPSLQSVYSSKLFTSDVAFFGNQKIWQLFSDEMKNIPTPYYTKDYALGLDEAVKAQADAFNGKNPADALKEAAKRLADRTKRTVNNG